MICTGRQRLVNTLDDSYEWTSQLYESIQVVSIGQPSDKSCHSSSENIIKSVTPKPTCNRCLLFCSRLLFRCTIHNNETPRQLQRPFVRQIFCDFLTETVERSLGLPGKWRAKHTRKDLYWCFLDIWSTPLQSKRNFGRVIWTFWRPWLIYADVTPLPRAGNPSAYS